MGKTWKLAKHGGLILKSKIEGNFAFHWQVGGVGFVALGNEEKAKENRGAENGACLLGFVFGGMRGRDGVKIGFSNNGRRGQPVDGAG